MSEARGESRERRPSAMRADALILSALRTRLVLDPHSSMADLADAAGVGMSAIYSRFGNRQQLLATLAREGVSIWADALQRAHEGLDRGEDPWGVLVAYLRTADAADVLALGSLGRGDEDERSRMSDLRESGQRLVRRLHRRGALRGGVTSDDLGKILEAVGSMRGDGDERTRMIRARFLRIAVDGLRPSLPPLRGEGPEGRDFDRRS
jgi:AcrR family transcriptional regulator